MDPIAGTLRLPTAADAESVAARLERGELISFAPCPFPLPDVDERALLFEQQLDGTEPRHIGLDPRSGRIHGCAPQTEAQADRLRRVLGQAADHMTRWLEGYLPEYAGGAELDDVAFHPEEEATRKLGTLDRNDLLHVDVPSERSQGRRLLRVYVNLHPTDARVWQTSLSFAELLERYGPDIGLMGPAASRWWRPWRQRLLRLMHGGRVPSGSFEDFMARLHDALKLHDAFQERAPKRCWQFKPGAAWVVFTDGAAHAELRGRFVLEFALHVAQHKLAHPELSPWAQFERACGIAKQAHAA